MRLVVLDGATLNPGDNPWTPLEAFGTVVVHDRTPPELVLDRARDADILLTNKTPLDGPTLASLPKLRGVCVLATGFNVVDVARAKQLGVPVCNVPSYSTESVAQHVIALLLELCNRVGLHDRLVHDGAWVNSVDFSFSSAPLIELEGLTLGVVGFGQIGRRVARLAQAFGMSVCATQPRRATAPVPDVTWQTVPELFSKSDVVTLHVPLDQQTRGFVDRSLLSTMKQSAFLINTARGALVREADLAWALHQRVIAGAAVDVIDIEPMQPEHPLLGAPNCVITPHIAWTSLRARRRLMNVTAANVRSILAGTPENVVNA